LTALKSDPALAAIPVTILSAIPDIGLTYRLGVADYLVKPVDTSRLAFVLEQQRSPAANGGVVLVVTHDAATRAALDEAIAGLGRPTLHPGTGLDALYAIHIDRPGVVLIDLTMPGFDVLQLLDGLQAKEHWRSIPVVGLLPPHLTLEQRRSLDTVVQQLLAKGGLRVEEFAHHLHNTITSRS
jgi:CheY-like chemotaxis protein